MAACGGNHVITRHQRQSEYEHSGHRGCSKVMAIGVYTEHLFDRLRVIADEGPVASDARPAARSSQRRLLVEAIRSGAVILFGENDLQDQSV